MPLPPELPVVDHHCHLSPTGEGIAAVRRFAAAGGTHLFLATQNYAGDVPTRLDHYRSQFEITERLAEAARRDAGVHTYPVLAPYPVDLIAAAEKLGRVEAVALQRAAVDLAGRWVREGRAVALGEVGVPHFPVAPDLLAGANEVLDHSLSVAHDVGCPVVVHGPDLTPAEFRALSVRARERGLPPERVVKHYARRFVPSREREGVAASYVARRELVEEALPDAGPWFLETDFLDDPRRPGAVLDLATVPRRATAIAARSDEAAERLRIPFVESVRRVYGWIPVVGGGGRST